MLYTVEKNFYLMCDRAPANERQKLTLFVADMNNTLWDQREGLRDLRMFGHRCILVRKEK